MPSQRTPGGVWLSFLLAALAACGDDTSSATSAAGGGASGSSDATSGPSSTSNGSTTSSSSGPSSSSSSSSSGDGGGGAGTTTGDGGGGSNAGGDGGAGTTSGTGGAAQGGGGAGTGGDGGTTSSGTGGDGGAGPGTGTGGAGTGGDATTTTTGTGTGGGPDGTRVRIVSANLTSGNNQSYDPGHGIRILQGIDGDIILVQEMRYGNNGTAAQRAFADAICGAECDYAREPIGGNGDLPNGIVSRYPIVDSGTWDDTNVTNRGYFWARIDMPGPGDLLAVSVHLHTTVSSHPEEGQELVEHINDEMGPSDVVVLGGDFNTDTVDDLLFPELDDIFRVTEPWPVDNLGNPNTNENRTKRYDWVLADSGLDELEIPVVIGAQSFPTGLVVDTRVYTPLSDLAPAQLNDSDDSVTMQHMAVVRDFAFSD